MARKSHKPPRVTSPRHATPPIASQVRGDLWPAMAVCGLLAAAIAVAFGPALAQGFLHFDDDIYVWGEPHVRTGLSAENWRWAWTHSHAANWHPLTTLSHMLDCQIFGLREWGHHLGNLVLHAVAAILVFLVVKRMTGRLWPSAALAGIFAVHPLRVESVVWVAERKDLLCAVFCWATVGAYVGYARRPFSVVRYLLVVFCFALALLAKPMAVSLPLLLLVLDYWPLRRMAGSTEQGAGSDRVGSLRAPCSVLPAILLEKLPLLAMSAALSVKTLVVQREAVQLNASIPFSARVLNALMSYREYIIKTCWSTGLSAHYPFPRQLPTWQAAAGAAAVLLAITAVAIALRRSRPYLLVGWLWYLGLLAPVIGLVQVGRQAMANRYTYLPQIGLLLMIVFAAADFLAPRRRPVTSLVMVLLLALLAAACWRQTQFWRDDIALMQRALDCNDEDAEMQNNMAAAMLGIRDYAAARLHAERAIAIDPDSVSGQANLAKSLLALGKPDEALPHAERCVDLAPGQADFRLLLANALKLNHRDAEAAVQAREGLRLRRAGKL